MNKTWDDQVNKVVRKLNDVHRIDPNAKMIDALTLVLMHASVIEMIHDITNNDDKSKVKVGNTIHELPVI